MSPVGDRGYEILDAVAGVSTSISCDDGAVRDWLTRVTALTGRRMQDLTVVMPINRAVYAGTCLMWTDGFSISMIPVGSSFDKLVVHEAGGHGFAKLLDEYVYYETEIPAKTRSEIESFKKLRILYQCGLFARHLPDDVAGFRRAARLSDGRNLSRGGHLPFGDLASGGEQLHERQCRLFQRPEPMGPRSGVSGGSPASRIIRSTRFCSKISAPGLSGRNALGNRGICPASCRQGPPVVITEPSDR